MVKAKKLVRQIAQKRRTLLPQGVSKDLLRSQAVLEALHGNVKHIKKSLGGISQTDLDYLERKTKPSKLHSSYADTVRRIRFRLAKISKKSKISRIKQVFGNEGEKLGIILIKPEMFGIANKIRKSLNSQGFRVIFNKNIVFNKDMIHVIYGDEFSKQYDFQIQGINLMKGPSKVLVFKQLPREELYQKSEFLKKLKEKNPEEYAQTIADLNNQSILEVFSTIYKGGFDNPLPKSLRNQVVYPHFKRFKQESKGYLGQLLDPFGYFRKKASNKQSAYRLSGIHAISTPTELFQVLDAFFSKKEITLIDKKTKTANKQ